MRAAIVLVGLGVGIGASGVAHAQAVYYDPTVRLEAPDRSHLAAPRNAFELSLATGYTQGFGSLETGNSVSSVANAGIGFELGLGWRINPRWAVLWAGQWQDLGAERTQSSVNGFTNSIAVQYHFAPTLRTDPWAEFGAGYRFLWESFPYQSDVTHSGWQLARVRLGLDFRIDESASIGPVVGADVNLFQWTSGPGYSFYNGGDISTFLWAGVLGRFDIGGDRTRYAHYAIR